MSYFQSVWVSNVVYVVCVAILCEFTLVIAQLLDGNTAGVSVVGWY